MGWRDKWQVWREWRSAIEEVGVAAFMFADLALEEALGVALLRRPLPVAAVNTTEVVVPRPYTAPREVVHLMLASAREESSALDEASNSSASRRPPPAMRPCRRVLWPRPLARIHRLTSRACGPSHLGSRSRPRLLLAACGKRGT